MISSLGLSLPFIFLIVILIANIFLIYLSLKSNPHSKTTQSFSLLVLVMSMWITVFYFESEVSDQMLSKFLVKADFALGGMIAVTFLNFVTNFPTTILSKKITRIKYIFGSLSLLAVLGVFTPYFITGYEFSDEGVEIITGDLFYIYALVVVITLILGTGILIRRYFSEQGYRQQQIKFVIWGFTLTAGIAVTASLILPRLFDSPLFVTTVPRLGLYGVSLFLGFTTYAIAKHRLMDIRLAIRALVLRMIVGVVIGVGFYYSSKLFTLQYIDPSPRNIAFFTALSAFILIIIYDPLNRFVRWLTDSFLFQGDYSRQELMRNLGRVVTQSIDLEKLQDNVIDTLQKAMRTEKVEFWLKDHQTGDIVWDQVQQTRQMIVYDELVRNLENPKEESEREHLEAIRDRMRDQEIAVVLPLVTNEGVVGMLLLSDKKGGDAYTGSDLYALETLMYQTGVAIENALLYTETQQFNVKLQGEVKKATVDLEQRNRRLTVLRRLDRIVLSSFDLDPLAQKIVDLVSWEMGFNGAIMVLLESHKDSKYLRPAAVSETPSYISAMNMLPAALSEYKIPWGLDPSNYFYRAIKEQKPLSTDRFEDLLVPPLNHEQAIAVQQRAKAKYLAVYPIYARSIPLGAIAFDLQTKYEELSHDEKELIESFIDEVGIAIDNSRLYIQLQSKNTELKKTNLRLKELDQMKDELVSVASHELRTPMTVIKSYLWMALNKEGKNLNENLKKYLDRAYLSSERMIDLVNDMLSASRLEGKRIELQIQSLDIRRIINDVVTNLKTKAEEKGLDLSSELPEGEYPNVLIDESRTTEILFNLIGNAVKYTDQGRIWVTLSVNDQPSRSEPSSEPGQKYMWVSVHDTGRGIAENDLPRLFKKFGKLEQGKFTKTAETGGTGLGLYITKGLVELHGGKLWVESVIEKGSVFIFSVKVSQ